MGRQKVCFNKNKAINKLNDYNHLKRHLIVAHDRTIKKEAKQQAESVKKQT